MQRDRISAILTGLLALLLIPTLLSPASAQEQAEPSKAEMLKWAEGLSQDLLLDRYIQGGEPRLDEFLEMADMLAEQGLAPSENQQVLLDIIRLLPQDGSQAQLLDLLGQMDNDADDNQLAAVAMMLAISLGRRDLLDATIGDEQIGNDAGSQQFGELALRRVIHTGDADTLAWLGLHGAQLSFSCAQDIAYGYNQWDLPPGFAGQALLACGLREDGGQWLDSLAWLLPYLRMEDLQSWLPGERDFSVPADYDCEYFLPAFCVNDPAKLDYLMAHGLDLAAYVASNPGNAVSSYFLEARLYSPENADGYSLLPILDRLAASGIEIAALAGKDSFDDGSRPGWRVLDRILSSQALYIVRHGAADTDLLETAEYFAGLGLELNGSDSSGGNLLHRLLVPDLPVTDVAVMQLIKLGLDPLQRDETGLTPLEMAIASGRSELAQQMYAEWGQEDAVALALLGRLEDCTAQLLAMPEQQRYETMILCMLAAGRQGDTEMLTGLAALGYHIPIQALLYTNDPQFLATWLDSGNYDVLRGHGVEEPFNLAVRQDNPQMLATLLAHEPYARFISQPMLAEAVMLAINEFRGPQLQLLLDFGAIANAPFTGDDPLSNPLHLAVHLEWVEGVRSLLEHGADPNAGLYHSEEFALEYGNPALSARGGFKRQSARREQAEIDDIAVMRLLVEHGALLNYYVPYGDSVETADFVPVLYVMSFAPSPAFIDAMLELGADPAAEIVEQNAEPRYTGFIANPVANLCGTEGIQPESVMPFARAASDEMLLGAIKRCMRSRRADLLALLLDNLDVPPDQGDQQELVNMACMFMEADCLALLLERGYVLPDGGEALQSLGIGLVMDYANPRTGGGLEELLLY